MVAEWLARTPYVPANGVRVLSFTELCAEPHHTILSFIIITHCICPPCTNRLKTKLFKCVPQRSFIIIQQCLSCYFFTDMSEGDGSSLSVNGGNFTSLCPNGSEWIWYTLGECTQDSRDMSSVVLGLLSIACFIVSSFP